MGIEFKDDLIAPCSMNCGICKRYLLSTRGLPKQKGFPLCAGCRPRNKKCTFIKSCTPLSKGEVEFCFQCSDFPCEKLKRLDKRYISKYSISLIENLLAIKNIEKAKGYLEKAGNSDFALIGGEFS